MSTSYHESATTTVAFNPYLPAIGRVLEVLRGYGPDGTTIEICNRELAIAAGCSPGGMPKVLRTLEDDGMIERVTSSRGSLITVLRSPMGDRDSASQCDDQTLDRDSTVDRRTPNETPDRSAAAVKPDQFIDPPHTPLYGKHDSMQQQHARVSESPLSNQAGPPPEPLNASEWARIVAGTPGYTRMHFAQDLQKGPSRPDIDNWIGLIVAARSRGEEVYSGAEVAQRSAVAGAEKRQESTNAGHNAPNQPRRSKHDSRRNTASHFPAGWSAPAWLVECDNADSAVPAL